MWEQNGFRVQAYSDQDNDDCNRKMSKFSKNNMRISQEIKL